jgi:hypothetical protein
VCFYFDDVGGEACFAVRVWSVNMIEEKLICGGLLAWCGDSGCTCG